MIINNGDFSTIIRNVTLSFAPYEDEGDNPDAFSDITFVMLSNQPDFAGAVWQPFEQDIPWTLDVQSLRMAHVYARFMDAAGNLSLGTEIDGILYQPYMQYLPLTAKK